MTQTIATVDEHSSVAALDEALAHCVATAKRTPTHDYLSRLNPTHAALHGYLDHLLDLRLAAA